jgi:hypothetical protein
LPDQEISTAEINSVVNDAIINNSKYPMPDKAILNAVAAVAQKKTTKEPITIALVCRVISWKDVVIVAISCFSIKDYNPCSAPKIRLQ